LLEVNAHRPGVWVREGQCMLEQARTLAEPLDARAVDTLTG
jgi:hypothetical protein